MLVVEAFSPPSPADAQALRAEGAALLSFVAADAVSCEIRIVGAPA